MMKRHQKLWLIIFVPLILSLMASSVNAAETETVTPSDDVFVYSINPDQNYNYYPAWTNLQASRSGSIYWRTWLKFTIPSGLTIGAARLYLYQDDGAFPPNPVVTIHYSTNDSWTENNITWNNQPDYGDSIDSKTVSVGDAWYSWNVTSVVSSNDTISFVLKSTIDEGYTYFCSKEYADSNKRPYLLISSEEEEEEEEGPEPDVDITLFPQHLAATLNIGLFPAQILLSGIIMLIIIVPLSFLKAKGILLVIVGFPTLIFLVALGWLPFWIVLLITLFVAIMYASKIKGMI